MGVVAAGGVGERGEARRVELQLHEARAAAGVLAVRCVRVGPGGTRQQRRRVRVADGRWRTTARRSARTSASHRGRGCTVGSGRRVPGQGLGDREVVAGAGGRTTRSEPRARRGRCSARSRWNRPPRARAGRRRPGRALTAAWMGLRPLQSSSPIVLGRTAEARTTAPRVTGVLTNMAAANTGPATGITRRCGK